MKKICTIAVIAILSLSAQTVKAQGVKHLTSDTLKFIIKSDIFRFFSGTFHLGAEVPFKDNIQSLYVAGMYTYYTTMGNSNEQIIGPGIELQYRRYLSKKMGPTRFPFYFGFHGFYRHVELYKEAHTEYNYDYLTNISTQVQIPEDKDVSNVYYGGVVLGYQQMIGHVISLDFFFGGGLRLTYDAGSKSPTKYKTLGSRDYSGVLPRCGLTIGILQR